jgi:hypothetical protein
MTKPIIIKGKIQFVGFRTTEKSILMKYNEPTFQDGFKENLTDTMMSSFENLKLTNEEKKHLSRSHRKLLNYYRHLNLFTLNSDAKKLVHEINHSKQSHIIIEANHYGAYVCLAALFSGKLSEDKTVEFILEKAPLALFPKAFIKTEPKNKNHKVVFRLAEDCWLTPFSSLYNNQRIKCSLKSFKKSA